MSPKPTSSTHSSWQSLLVICPHSHQNFLPDSDIQPQFSHVLLLWQDKGISAGSPVLPAHLRLNQDLLITGAQE